jgi:GAF domain
VFDTGMIAAARSTHALARYRPMIQDALRSGADDLTLISDAGGNILWCEGPPALRRCAEAVGLADGSCWSEGAVGTNGIGTALSTGTPAHVFAAEHFAPALRRWSCAAAPIADPDTGRLIGSAGIAAMAPALHHATSALVAAVARLAEAQLTLDMHGHDERLRARYGRHLAGLHGVPGALVSPTGRVLAAEPSDWCGGRIAVPEPGGYVMLPDGRTARVEPLGEVYLLRALGNGGRDSHPEPRGPLLTLSLLGTERYAARLDGHRIPLSLRHAEILALLALHPCGLTGEQMSAHLYGDEGSPVTIRAEIHRLRALLGQLLPAKPYRLACTVDADFLTIRSLLATGDTMGAARLWRGPLLPRSESLEIIRESHELTVALRGQLLRSGDAEGLWLFAQTDSGRADVEVLERIAELLPAGDPRRVCAGLRALM